MVCFQQSWESNEIVIFTAIVLLIKEKHLIFLRIHDSFQTRIIEVMLSTSTIHIVLFCIFLSKAALEILKWNQEETQFVIIGKVFFTSITDYTVNRKTKTMKFLTASALLATLGRPNQNYRPDLVHSTETDKNMVFTRDNTGISDAVLLLIKEKGGRYALCKVCPLITPFLNFLLKSQIFCMNSRKYLT